MKLFYFKPKKYTPIQILVSKLNNEKEFIKIKEFTDEIFNILYDQKNATLENILIFSIIKDYNQTTENLVLPSINSNPELTQTYVENTNLVNSLIVDTLNHTDCEFYFEIINYKILIHPISLNLGSFIEFYSLENDN